MSRLPRRYGSCFGKWPTLKELYTSAGLNPGEVYYNTTRDYSEARALSFLKDLEALPLRVVSVSDAQVDLAAHLKARHPFSYADGFAAALAIERSLPLVTGDRDFLTLAASGLLQIHWIGA